MAVITISRQVAALGDEVAGELAKRLGYKFITRKEIEKRIVELGFPESKMPKFDERKPGFFASITKNRDDYFILTQYAVLEAAKSDNAVIIGRGAFAILKNIPNVISVRLVADENTRVKRLMDEFSWNEKQARQRITESDENRNGFHKNFYNVDVGDPSNFDMVLNTGIMSIPACAQVISDYTKIKITPDDEKAGQIKVAQLLKAQEVVKKLIFEYKIRIEFLHVTIEDNAAVLYGVTNSNVIVEQALKIIRQELPEYEVKSAVSIVQEYKTFQ